MIGNKNKMSLKNVTIFLNQHSEMNLSDFQIEDNLKNLGRLINTITIIIIIFYI